MLASQKTVAAKEKATASQVVVNMLVPREPWMLYGFRYVLKEPARVE